MSLLDNAAQRIWFRVGVFFFFQTQDLTEVFCHLNSQAAHEKKAAREKPTAAPSELVVRERTGGKVRAPVVPQDPAVGIRLLSVQVFNKKTYSFLCTDSANDHQWTVERSFKCIDQLYHALVDWKYVGAEDLSKPENSAASVDRFLRELLRSGCKMAAVLLSEVDAQNKEADKAQWRVVAKRSQLIFRRVEFFDGASATPLFRYVWCSKDQATHTASSCLFPAYLILIIHQDQRVPSPAASVGGIWLGSKALRVCLARPCSAQHREMHSKWRFRNLPWKAAFESRSRLSSASRSARFAYFGIFHQRCAAFRSLLGVLPALVLAVRSILSLVLCITLLIRCLASLAPDQSTLGNNRTVLVSTLSLLFQSKPPNRVSGFAFGQWMKRCVAVAFLHCG